MNNESFLQRKGFYIVLVLCLSAIGTAGYVNFISDEPEFVLNDTTLTVSNESNDVEYVPSVTPTPIVKDTVEELEEETEEKSENKENVGADVPDIVIETEVIFEEILEVSPLIEDIEVTKEQVPTYVRPVVGQVINHNSNDELVLDQTMNTWRTHNATDYSAPAGTNVVAIADGVVRSITTDDLYGTIVTIEHLDGLITKTYGLNADTVAKIDKEVVAGDVIGTAMGIFPADEKLGEHIQIESTKNGENFDIETLNFIN